MPLYVAGGLLHVASGSVGGAVWNAYALPPELLAGVCAIYYARRAVGASRTQRVGWALIGFSSLAYLAGDALWMVYENVLHREVPFPGWCDVAYLLFYPLMIGGIVLLFDELRIVRRARLLLDSAIGAGGVGMICWFYLIEPTWRTSSTVLLGKVVGVAYPIADVAVLCAALTLITVGSEHATLRRSLGCLAAGVSLQALSDVLYTYATLAGTYKPGSLIDCGWGIGCLLIAYAPLSKLWGMRSTDAERASEAPAKYRGPDMFRAGLPYLAAAGAMLLVVSKDYANRGYVCSNVVWASGGLMLLVILRQVFTLMENQDLAQRLARLNHDLEMIVDRRTKELRSLHQLTKAVTTTLDTDTVLEAAGKHSRMALHADAVVVWMLDGPAASSIAYPKVRYEQGLPDDAKLIETLHGMSMCGSTMMHTVSPRAEDEIGDGWILHAPLRWQQRPIGMIGVIRWDSRFEPNDVDLLEGIGLEVGTALENAHLYASAKDAADRDPVTGLFNHRAIHQRLSSQMDVTGIADASLAVVLMDLNNFRLFNDVYGHPEGDAVLKRVARILTEMCKSDQVIGRYGGDEFVAVLPMTDLAEATEWSHRVRDRIAEEGFQPKDDQRTIPITMSFGVAMYPADGVNRHELLAIADACLMTAQGMDSGIKTTESVDRANISLQHETSFSALETMVIAVDNKDHYTRRHSEGVTEYALWIAEELGLSDETMRAIRIAGLLHDVGKIGVPDEILRKPGRLTEEEFDIMKRHPWVGEMIMKALPEVSCAVDGVRGHHERWDGRGYPAGLAGDDIPLLGRILAVADAFSAMTTTRPYRKEMSWEEALEEVRNNIGSQFDPQMAEAFLAAAVRQGRAPAPDIRRDRAA